jgi:hypothetical protein
LFAFLVEQDGKEGVPAFRNDDGEWFPMVGADMARVESFMEIARILAKASGQRFRVFRFTRSEQIGEVNP